MSSATPLPVRRDPQHGYLAGVCAGFAARVGIDPLWIRIGFVVAVALGGVAIPLYAIAWLLIPADGPERPAVQRLLTRSDTWLVAAGMGCLTAAGLLLLRTWDVWFVNDNFLWPLVIAATGGALIWRQSQTAPERIAQRARLPRQTVNRATAGVALVVGGALIFLYVNDALAPARDVVLPVLVMLVALVIILAPWIIRLVRGLEDERTARIRSQERAEVAAHLHDSVLQTLALVQKRADDPREVAALARRQERELRAWLNGTRNDQDTIAGALRAAAEEVEGDHQVPIDVVTVGDAPLDERAAGPPSSPDRSRSRSTPRWPTDAPRCSYAIVAPASPSRTCRTTGAASVTLLSVAWSAMEAARRCTRRPAREPRSSW
jgi:phage shock protein PspC (stress-responsive transcriptional regulator)